MNEEERAAYGRYVARRAPASPVWRDCFAAFWVGGLICAAAEGLTALYRALGMPGETVGPWVTVTMIFAAAVLTGLGWFDNVARYAGAGTLVPVTGFANAVTSPAIDTKSEGLLLGVGGKIFTIAGPVLLFGILAGAVYGVIYYVVGLFGGAL